MTCSPRDNPEQLQAAAKTPSQKAEAFYYTGMWQLLHGRSTVDEFPPLHRVKNTLTVEAELSPMCGSRQLEP